MKTTRLSLLLLLLTFHSSHAGEAVFSRGGDFVYKLDDSGPGTLKKKNAADGTSESIDLSGKLEGESVLAVDRDREGRILCATKSSVWAWDDRKNAAEKLCSIDEGWTIEDVTHDPATGVVVIGVKGKTDDWPLPVYRLYALPEGEASLIKVNTRRVNFIEGMAFSPDGHFYFGTEGDLWAGVIQREEWTVRSENPAVEGEKEVHYTLAAFRYAPLATRESQNMTPSQTGVRAVAVTDKHVYAHVARMGGSGWGDVVRLARPKLEKGEDGKEGLQQPFGLAEYLKIYQHALGSVEILGSNGRRAFLCASPEGTRVHHEMDRD